MSVPQPAVRRRRLRDLNFGFASADFEASQNPELLLKGFLDLMGVVEEAKNGNRWLFLGYKGSGKSALGEHLRLLSEQSPDLFVKFVNIADVSFSTFSQILKGAIEPEARYPLVWSWLLLLFLLDSFSADEGSNYSSNDQLFYAVEVLRNLGLLPDPDLKKLVSETADKAFSVKLAGILGSVETTFKSTTRSSPELPFFVERLKQVGRTFRSKNRHLLVIDGFDELLRRGNLQYDALGSLLFEANRLNNELSSAGTSAKVVVLCRTDLFERLPGPNKNKIRQDCALHMDWYTDPRRPEESGLVQLINLRASLSFGSNIDVFDMHLPPTLDSYRDDDTRAQLLEHTRHVPRDMIMLFRKLQEFSGDGAMTRGQVVSALGAYSRDHLLPEIIDEMDGYVDLEHIPLVLDLFGAVRKTTPTLYELEQQAKQLAYPINLDLKAALRVLFDCSAIGNLAPSSSGTRVTFKFRNRHASFNQTQRIVVHRGLWRAFNLS